MAMSKTMNQHLDHEDPEHFPEKWAPVFRRKCDQARTARPVSASIEAETGLERDDVELLLPWYVTGRLDRADAARVEARMARDPDLALRVELAREEHDESIVGHVAIGPRPARNADRLLAELERREAPRLAAFRTLWDRVLSFLATPPVGAMRLAGAAAAILIVAQAGVVATMLTRQPAADYAPASGGIAATERHAVALVGFVGDATTAAVVDLLAAHGMSMLHGPDTGGYFTVRLGPKSMSEAERQAKIAVLKSRGDIVAFVLPLR
jgi:hypothetical protein